eukprot:s128_g15.t2
MHLKSFFQWIQFNQDDLEKASTALEDLVSDLEHSTDDALQKKGIEISNWLPEARKVVKDARAYLSAAKTAKKDQIDKDMMQVAEAHVSTVSEMVVAAKEKGLSENASDFDLYDPPDLAPSQPGTASLEGCAVQADSPSLQVRRLHSILEDRGAHSFDRALAARCLVALYGRCRNSDLSDIQWVEHEFKGAEGYLVLYLGVHKSNNATARSKKLLPVLIPAKGITGDQWLCHAMAALEHVGMRVEGRVSGPLLKAALDAEADHLSDREIRASEISSFLRIALKSVCDDERLQRPQDSVVIDVSSDSDSSSSSSSSTSGSSEDEAPPAKVQRGDWPWRLDKSLMHSKSRKCHYIVARSGGGNAILACGKVGSANFTTPTNFSQVAGTCQICRRAVV